MLSIVRPLLLLDFIAIICEHLLPSSHGILPIGGSHLTQIGILLILSLIIVEAAESARNLRNRLAKKEKNAENNSNR